jgi:hypothetical protein
MGGPTNLLEGRERTYGVKLRRAESALSAMSVAATGTDRFASTGTLPPRPSAGHRKATDGQAEVGAQNATMATRILRSVYEVCVTVSLILT